MKDFIEFKWKYLLYQVISYFRKPLHSSAYLFISHEGTRDWILGAKARRLSSNLGLESEAVFTQNFKNIPIAKGYFFLHQRYYAKALRYNPHLKKSNTIVMFTHPEWNKFYSKNQARYTLSYASKIICLNKNMATELVELGIDKNKIMVYHLASEPDFFYPKIEREGKTVGFCCFYSDRKNPELIFDLVMGMPDLNFILIGQNWEKYPKFTILKEQSNFTYYDNQPYDSYPALYNTMDVFVSPSYLEGGPVPLLEAMLSNIVPVASTTGFCPDIIKHGENGFLFDAKKTSISDIKDMIRQALTLTVYVRKDVESHSWVEYGKKLNLLFKELENKQVGFFDAIT